MKKYILFFGLIIFCNSLIFAQTLPSLEPSFYDSLSYNNSDCKFITVFIDKERGTFKFRTQNGLRSLLYDEKKLGTYTSHANFWIGDNMSVGKVFSMRPDLAGTTAVTIEEENFSKENDRFKVEFKEPEVEGVKIMQELIVRENSAKESGAVLIKYTLTNISKTETKFVGVALKLDTYLGYHLMEYDGTYYYPIAEGNDRARIALPTGFIHAKTNINPIPDYWLAFEDEEDRNALIARGTLRGKDLVPPDFLYAGEYEDIRYILYDERNLPTGGGYGDSEIFMRWNRQRIGPGETISVATLYGMLGAVGCVDTVFSINSEPPFDTLTVDDNGKYEPNQFDYIATVHSVNSSDTVTNVIATIHLDPDGPFELDNNYSYDQKIGTLKFGEGQVVSWKIRINDKYKCISKLESASIGVIVTGERVNEDGNKTVSNFCPNTVYFLPKEIYSLNLKYDSARGTVTKTPNKDKYFCNEMVEIRAISKDSFEFNRWEGDITGNNMQTMSVHMDDNKTITAIFVRDSFNLTINVTGIGNTEPVAGVHRCKNGEAVPVTATAGQCYDFVGWEGDIIGDNMQNPMSVFMDDDKTITARFVQKVFSLTTSVNIDNSASVSISPNKTAYDCGDEVRLTVNIDPCYDFLYWEDDPTNSKNPRDITMDNGSKHYRAVLAIKRFTLSSSTDYPNSGNITPKIDTCDCGEIVKLSITPECHYDFVRWDAVALNSTQREISIVIDTNKNIVARMAKISFDVLKSEPNIFPNIVVDLKIDSALYNSDVFQLPVIRSQFTVIDVDSVGNSKEIKDFNLVNNSQIVYSLYGNCYDKITDLKRKTIVKFVRNGCTDTDTAMYTINLNAGCDSCSRPLKRVLQNNLSNNRPNPYNPETIIRYSIAEDDHVFIAVYDILGREVATLVNEHKEAGEYEILFRPKGLTSGVYFYRMKTNNFHDVKKMTFLK